MLNHVLLHQTIIGLEAKKQLEKIGEKKAGRRHRLRRRRQQLRRPRLPVRRRQDQRREDRDHPGRAGGLPDDDRRPFVYDHGDTAGMTPLLPMHSLGHAFVPAADPRRRPALPRHGAAGLPGDRRRADHAAGDATRSSATRPRSCARRPRASSPRRRPATPSPRSSSEAKKAKEEGKEKVILFNLSGHGLMDLTGYERYFSKQLEDYELPQEDIDAALGRIKDYPKPTVNRTGRW